MQFPPISPRLMALIRLRLRSATSTACLPSMSAPLTSSCSSSWPLLDNGSNIVFLSRATRTRVNFFMNKFRKLGLIDYNGKLEVHKTLLNFVLNERPHIELDSPDRELRENNEGRRHAGF
jgi:hypothetical protein